MSGTRRRPRVVALADQLEAADMAAVSELRSLADRLGGTVGARSLGGPSALILRGLVVRVASVGLDLCRHLDPGAPAPTWWSPGEPGLFRCFGCHAEAGQQPEVTAPRRRCDSCQRRGRRHPGLITLPPLLVTARGEVVWALPPVTLSYALCPRCYAADGDPAGVHR